MPRSRRLTGLIILNETQLAGGASGARAVLDSCTQLPGDTEACSGHAWALLPISYQVQVRATKISRTASLASS